MERTEVTRAVVDNKTTNALGDTVIEREKEREREREREERGVSHLVNAL